MGKKRKRKNDEYGGAEVVPYTESYVYSEPTIEGAYFYQYKGDMPWDLQRYVKALSTIENEIYAAVWVLTVTRYWVQRYDFFSLYHQGVWTTDNSWFEVTPEAIALTISDHVTAALPENRSIIVDAFCGIGGNAIAFARSGKFKRVYAIEKDEAALACAKHNAELYGVADQITWFHGDCFEILGVDETNKQNAVSALKEVISQFGVIFASPPWGGPGYKAEDVFNLDQMQPYSLEHIYSHLSKVTRNLIMYLPRTSDLQQIANCVDDGHKSQIIHYCTSGGSRALCAYLGDWSHIETPSPVEQVFVHNAEEEGYPVFIAQSSIFQKAV